jgi:hypothetical protein
VSSGSGASRPALGGAQSAFAASARDPGASKSKLPVMLVGLLLVGGLGAGGYYVYTTKLAKKSTEVAAGPGSAKSGSAEVTPRTGSAEITPRTGSAEVKPRTGSADVKTGSATQAGSADVKSGSATEKGSAVAMTGSAGSASESGSAAQKGSAGSAAVVAATPDAAVDKSGTDTATTNVAKPTGASSDLQIASNPKGAHVFIDGADQGTAPVKLPGSSDRHTLAVFMPDYDLYVAEIDGHGVFAVDLKQIEKPKHVYGGIKVLKCKKDRFYIYLDGQPTGQTCPSERINTTVGTHTVEIYDIVTEARRKFDITVKDTGASERIRLE